MCTPKCIFISKRLHGTKHKFTLLSVRIKQPHLLKGCSKVLVLGCVKSSIWLKINEETIGPSVIADYGVHKLGRIPEFGRIPRAGFIRALSRRMGCRATDVASHMEKSFVIRYQNPQYFFFLVIGLENPPSHIRDLTQPNYKN